jgi:glycosyltransferase involved in cell wall biosynthesis
MVVLTSRREGCASVMLEAMMAGRVQLVTPVGGVGDWLTDGRDAFVADEVSSAGVERALRRALAVRERWPGMGQAARQAFEQEREHDPVGRLMGILYRAAAFPSPTYRLLPSSNEPFV